MRLLVIIYSPEDFQGRLQHFTLNRMGSESGFLLWVKLEIQVNFMSPEQCLLKSGDGTRGPSPLQFLDQTECNCTYISWPDTGMLKHFSDKLKSYFPWYFIRMILPLYQ